MPRGTPFGGVPVRNVDAPRSKPQSIERPCAGSRHRQPEAQTGQYEVRLRRGWPRKRDRDLGDRQQRARDGRPPADKKRRSCHEREPLQKDRLVARNPCSRIENRRYSCGDTHQQQAGAGPAARESREQAAQKIPGMSLGNPEPRANPRIGSAGAPLSGGLQVLQRDDSALQPDRDGVGAIVGGKLGKDVLDVPLDGFLRNRQPRGDRLVRIS